MFWPSLRRLRSLAKGKVVVQGQQRSEHGSARSLDSPALLDPPARGPRRRNEPDSDEGDAEDLSEDDAGHAGVVGRLWFGRPGRRQGGTEGPPSSLTKGLLMGQVCDAINRFG